MLDEGTWMAFRSLLKASKRKVIVESHIKLLDTCKKEHLTPIGMTYKPKVTFKHHNENKKYNSMLTNTSKKTLKMTYKSFVKEHKTFKSQILQEESNLKKVATYEETKFVQEKINKTCRVTKCKMDKIKERNLRTLTLSYPGGGAKYAPLLFFLHHPKTDQGIKLKLSDFKDTLLRHILQVKPVR